MTALLFVLAWATSGINGWFYVGNYGVPWFDKQPVIVGFPVTTIFLVLAIACGLLAGWLHFRMDYAGHTQVADTGRNRARGVHPAARGRRHHGGPRAGVDAQGHRRPLPRLHHRRGQHIGADVGTNWVVATSCAMADAVLVEADTNAGTLQPVPGQRFGEYGPLGGEDPVGFTPNGVSDTLEPAEPVAANPGIGELRRAGGQTEHRRSATRRAPAAATAPRESTDPGCSCRSGWTRTAPR